MNRLFHTIISVLLGTVTILANSEVSKVELPFRLCGQNVYKVGSQTTMTIDSRQYDAYELVGVADTGMVCYLPQRQALLLDNAVIDYRQSTYVIQSLTDFHLTLVIRGENHITSIGTVAYSTGQLTVCGEGIDSSTLHLHGIYKKGYNLPEYGLFSGRDMTLTDLTFHAEGFRYTFYGIQAFDEKTTLWLERVQGDIQTRGNRPCVARGFNELQMQGCEPAKAQHADQLIRYYGHLDADGDNCRELHLVADGGQQPTDPAPIADEPVVEEPVAETEPVAEEPAAKESADDERVFDVVEQQPYYDDNGQSLMQYLSANLRYPAICEEQGVQGRVLLQFVVELDGTLSDIKVLRSPDSHLTKEALRLVQSAPGTWHPAKQNGRPVRSRLTVPVIFKLKRK